MSKIQLIDQSELLQKVGEYIYHPLNTTCILVHTGTVAIDCNGSPVQLQAGSIFFIGYNKYYCFSEISQDAQFKVLNYDRNFSNRIRFSISKYDAYRLIHANSSVPFSPTATDFETIWTLISTLHQNRKKAQNQGMDFLQKANVNIFMAIIYLLAAVIYDAGERHLTIRNQRKEEITVQFLQLVADNYKQHRDLAFYAELLHISIKYLSICVREITKDSPSAILSNWLLSEARAQLIVSNKTINQLSQEFHFSDQYAFSKFFKKHVGITPNIFRERQATTVTN
ncbi:AraC family transcriptional regulator [Sphingobacterium sp. DR205]|uniref:helix-turn-helix domain-containing protein n=1 Tax=Sphingobacterium sp. DR205 TaxID=2713573 RepID=UPI0013E4C835|nr:AraC family transcriptional regulator [Sphingobacterium sp. DR205]QIH34370.1 helix-turn-helix transcriptional regulator [Sphingobacterium sp. DR205]